MLGAIFSVVLLGLGFYWYVLSLRGKSLSAKLSPQNTRYLALTMIFAGAIMLVSRSFVIVDAEESGHLKRIYFSGDLPPERIIATAEEKGPQAEILTPGFHFIPFVRDLFKIEFFPVISVPEGQYGLLVARDGKIIVGSFDGFVYAYEAKSGDVAWKVATRDHIYASPAQAKDGTIYVASADGRVKRVIAGEAEALDTANAIDAVDAAYALALRHGVAQWSAPFQHAGDDAILQLWMPWFERSKLHGFMVAQLSMHNLLTLTLPPTTRRSHAVSLVSIRGDVFAQSEHGYPLAGGLRHQINLRPPGHGMAVLPPSTMSSVPVM